MFQIVAAISEEEIKALTICSCHTCWLEYWVITPLQIIIILTAVWCKLKVSQLTYCDV